MLKYIQNKLKNIFGINSIKKTIVKENKIKLKKNLEANIALIQGEFHNSSDLELKRMRVGKKNNTAAIFYLDGMVNQTLIGQLFIGALKENTDKFCGSSLEEVSNMVYVSSSRIEGDFNATINALLEGDMIFLLDGSSQSIIADVKGWEGRDVTEPANEPAIRGPRESFVETSQVNTSMLRRKIYNKDLTFETITLGKTSKTKVYISYIKEICPVELYQEVKKRLDNIKQYTILDSGYLEEEIEDNPLSPFPSVRFTERPDTAAAHVAEGGVAVITDGSPQVILLPATLNSLMQSPDDYYLRYPIVSIIRPFRWLALFLGLSAPSLYIALSSFNQELIATPLLLELYAGREGIPYPVYVEVLLMETAFEILREASLRMPQPIGPAISIVGVLVIGDAAVRGGLVSPVLIIIVGLTAISVLAIPNLNLGNALRLWRFVMLFFSASFGLIGIAFAWFWLLINLTSMKSFGVPYLSPLAPLSLNGLKDFLFRLPWWSKSPLTTQRKEHLPKEEGRNFFNRGENKENE